MLVFCVSYFEGNVSDIRENIMKMWCFIGREKSLRSIIRRGPNVSMPVLSLKSHLIGEPLSSHTTSHKEAELREGRGRKEGGRRSQRILSFLWRGT